MSIYMGAININKIRIGGSSVAKMYVGDKLVYTSVVTVPNSNPQTYDDFMITLNETKKIIETYDEFYI